MICKNCGNYTQGEPKFCPFCGTPNENNPNSNSDSQQQYHYDAQQNAGSYSPFSGGGRSASIPYRSIALCVILSLLTCGFYALYWLYCVVNDLRDASNSSTEPDGGTVLLLSILTCGIYQLIWFYRAGEQVSEVKYNAGRGASSDGWLYLLLAILSSGLIPLALIQNELNRVSTR